MKNNSKPSKGQFSKNPKPAGQQFKSSDRPSQPKKYGSFDKKKNRYRREDGNGYFSDRDNKESTGYKGNRDNTGYKGNRDNAGYKGNRDSSGYKGNANNSGYKGNRDNAGYKGNKDNTGYKGNRDSSGYRGNPDNTGYKGNRDNSEYRGNNDNRQRQGQDGRYSENPPKKFSRDTYGGNKFNTFNKNYSDKKPRFENDRGDRFAGNKDRDGKFERNGKDGRYAPKGDKAGFNKPYNRKPDDRPSSAPQKKYSGNTNKFSREPYIKDTKNIQNIQEDVFENIRDMGSITFGRNAVIELLKSDKTIDKLFVQNNQREGSITMIVAEAVRKSIPVVEVEKQKLDKMINGTSHQGVVAMTSEVEYCSVDDILAVAEERNEKPFILIADKIMDAQNLGAIIRTAECAGVHGVIIPKRHAAGVSSVVGKISAGALFHIKIAKVANISSTMENLKEKGIWTFSSTSDSIDGIDNIDDAANSKEIKNYCEANYDLPLCLAVGNEGDGLSQIILQKSDFLINIPMYGKIESLNVSCAAAVLLYEIARQREAKKLQTD